MFNTFINIGNYNRIIFLTLPFHEISNPNKFINLWCHSLDNALVRTSTTMSSVEQYSNRTFPFSTRFRTKWCCKSMCCVRAWWVGFLVNDIAPWLSHQITITFFCSIYPKSIINFVIHMVFFHGLRVRHVLRLRDGQCYCRLSFATPRNGSTSNHENKPCGGPPIFKISTLIHITISKHFLRWCSIKL